MYIDLPKRWRYYWLRCWYIKSPRTILNALRWIDIFVELSFLFDSQSQPKSCSLLNSFLFSNAIPLSFASLSCEFQCFHYPHQVVLHFFVLFRSISCLCSLLYLPILFHGSCSQFNRPYAHMFIKSGQINYPRKVLQRVQLLLPQLQPPKE